MKLQTKLFIVLVPLALLTGALLLWLSEEAVNAILIEGVEQRALLELAELAPKANAGMRAKDEQALLPLLHSAAANLRASYALAQDTSGMVLAHTNVMEKGKLYGDPITRQALGRGQPVSALFSVQGREVLDVAVPVWAGDEDFFLAHEKGGKTRLGTLRVALPLQEALATRARILRRIASILMAGGGAMILVILLFLRKMLFPIRLLAESANRIRRGQYGVTVPVPAKDELGDLAQSFNRMSEELAATTVSKDYLDGVIRSIVDILIVTDSRGHIRTINRAALDMLGCAEAELLGRDVRGLFAASAGSLRETLDRAGFVKDAELSLVTKAGKEVPILLSGSVFRTREGQSEGIVIVAKDLTERKKAEERLRNALSLLTATLESTADGILVVNREGKISAYNQRFAQLWRIPQSVISQADDNLALKFVLEQLQQPEVFLNKVKELYQDPSAESFDVLEFKDGRTFERYSKPQQVEGVNVGRVWSFRDVSERKKLEARLLQSEKLSAVGRLAAGIAHEINNPLGVILGFSQSAASRIPASDALAMPLKSIAREALRCKDLVQNLLLFSRAHKAETLEELDINSALESAASLIQAQARIRSVELVKEPGLDIPKIRANRTQIQQILINLANNAIDAMPKGGTLSIRTALCEKRPGYVEIQVRDTGLGIPKELQARIFEPFFTTKEVGKGTGLGLALVYEIVHKFQGTIELESAPEKGTTFTVSLPGIHVKPAGS